MIPNVETLNQIRSYTTDTSQLPKLSIGLRHPKLALEYLLLGPREFKIIHTPPLPNMETCILGASSSLPFTSHMVRATDIHEHLTTLYMLTVQHGLKTTVELGTRTGESTVALLYAAREIAGRVYSFDLNACEEARRTIESYGLSKYWSFAQADDLYVTWDHPIDHLFIDTTHTYEQTVKELEKFEPFVRRGGVITMHDIVLYPDVKKAIIHHFAGRSDWRMYEYLNNNGLAVIFKT